MHIESLDLSQYTIEQLADLISRAEATIHQKKVETADALRKQVAQTAAALGITVTELLDLDKPAKRAAAVSKTTSKVAPKYRDNMGNTWTGRGQKPVWLREAIENGANLEDFLIG
ncbi:MAG: H-NS histone family protein [Pseudomonadota bacterium]